MIFLILSLITLALLAIVSFIFIKDILNPSFMYSIIWMIQLTGLIIFKDYFIETSEIALFLIVVGALSFSIGSFIGLFLSKRCIVPIPNRTINYSNIPYIAICVVAVISTLMQYRLFEESSLGSYDFATKLITVRTLITHEGEDIFGIYKYGGTIALITLGAAVVLFEKNKSRITLSIVLCLLLCVFAMGVFSTGRGKVLEPFMLALFIFIVYQEHRTLSLRLFISILGSIVIILLIFWIMGSAMGKASDNLSGLFDDLINYQFSSLPAFSYFLQRHPIVFFDGDYGVNTFRFLYALFSKLGLSEKPVSLIQEFVAVPCETNIYGIYHLYIKDFGLLGMCTLTIFVGAVHGALFYQARLKKGNDYAKILFAFSCVVMMKSFAGENYFTALSYWIQVLLILFFITEKRSKSALSSLLVARM